MVDESARLYITKLAAAQRQLAAAIRMFLMDEDELAIHTVASAAYRVLCDLGEGRGGNEVNDMWRNAIFYIVRDYHKGILPKYFLDDPHARSLVESFVNQVPITKETKIEEFSIDLPSEYIWEVRAKRNRISNFLKHADRDAKSYISEDDIDNETLLLQAYCLYLDLTNKELYPEGVVFMIFANARSNVDTLRPDDKYRKFVSDLSTIEEDKQKELCLRFLTALIEAC